MKLQFRQELIYKNKTIPKILNAENIGFVLHVLFTLHFHCKYKF